MSFNDYDEYEYTKEFSVSSSLIDSIHFNENDNTVVLDINDEMYLYENVTADDVAALVRGEGEGGSVGAHYNRVFKTKFGPGEHLGSWDDVDFTLVVANRNASAGVPNDWSFPTPAAASIIAEPTKEYSLAVPVNDVRVIQGNPIETKEYSLGEIVVPTSEEDENVDYTTTVYFTLDGYDEREYQYEAKTILVNEAIEQLNNHVSLIGAKGRVRKVVVEFE